MSRTRAAPRAEPTRVDESAALYAQAQQCQALGRYAEAQAALRKILRRHPDHFETLHLIGICEYQAGDAAGAVRTMRRALQINPASVEAHSNLATLLRSLGRPKDALASCDKALALNPGFADAHYNRGNALLALHRCEDAIAAFDAAIALDARYAAAYTNKGMALHELGRFVEALAVYDVALALKPGDVLTLNNRGCARKELRQLEDAVADFDRALALDPRHAGAWTNRGEVLLSLMQYDRALASFDKAVALDPKLTEAWLGRANVLMLVRRVAEGMAACEKALALDPHSVKGLTQLGQCYALQGQAEKAVACFERALAIKPDDEVALSNRIFSLDFVDDSDFVRHHAVRSEWWHRIGAPLAARPLPPHANDRDPARRLVLGYVSSDFRAISPAYTFRPVLQNHDKSRFEVVCYAVSPLQDHETAIFKTAACRWRDAAQWSDDRLIECIRADKVDILIDLSGHTQGNRLRVFARKPAPVQVTAWGNATGSGVPVIDYLFSDPVSVPADARRYFAERIYDLPSLLIVEPPPAEFRCPDPPAVKNGFLTYGLFNRISKFSDVAVAAWSRILLADPSARVLIKHQLIDDRSVQQRLRARFAAHGVNAERIDMLGSTPRDVHLQAYRHVDVCLDPFPQTGGVSTWEALYMGVPVVTKLGASVASRAAGGILTAVGLQEWVAADEDDYVAIALRSAPERLAAIRRDLPAQIAARCSPQAYTAAVEAAYRRMWEAYCGAPAHGAS